MTEDFDTALRSILGQLIEAREDQNHADKRLHDYRAANTPPEVPNEFENVDAFLDYHHRRQSYEIYLRQHENALRKAKKEYADAADQLGIDLHLRAQAGAAPRHLTRGLPRRAWRIMAVHLPPACVRPVVLCRARDVLAHCFATWRTQGSQESIARAASCSR